MLNITDLYKSKRNEFSGIKSDLPNFGIQRVALLLRIQVQTSPRPTILTEFVRGFPRSLKAFARIESAVK
jgi:hypothetical protein